MNYYEIYEIHELVIKKRFTTDDIRFFATFSTLHLLKVFGFFEARQLIF